MTVELNSLMYSVSESDHSLEICVIISNGSLERNTTVFMSTIDQTTTCKNTLLYMYACTYMACHPGFYGAAKGWIQGEILNGHHTVIIM